LRDTVIPYTTGSTTSVDGTTIGYRQIGSGPGLLLLPAGMQASQHYMRLATALADTLTVYVVDRVSHSFLQTVSTEQNREQPAASVPRFRPGPSDLYPERRDARLTFPCLLLVAL
jgi:hypothetical protein